MDQSEDVTYDFAGVLNPELGQRRVVLNLLMNRLYQTAHTLATGLSEFRTEYYDGFNALLKKHVGEQPRDGGHSGGELLFLIDGTLTSVVKNVLRMSPGEDPPHSSAIRWIKEDLPDVVHGVLQAIKLLHEAETAVGQVLASDEDMNQVRMHAWGFALVIHRATQAIIEELNENSHYEDIEGREQLKMAINEPIPMNQATQLLLNGGSDRDGKEGNQTTAGRSEYEERPRLVPISRIDSIPEESVVKTPQDIQEEVNEGVKKLKLVQDGFKPFNAESLPVLKTRVDSEAELMDKQAQSGPHGQASGMTSSNGLEGPRDAIPDAEEPSPKKMSRKNKRESRRHGQTVSETLDAIHEAIKKNGNLTPK